MLNKVKNFDNFFSLYIIKNMELKNISKTIAIFAREASYKLAKMNTDEKNNVLISLTTHLRKNKAMILEANKLDIAAIKETGVEGSDSSRLATMIDRLTLDDTKIENIIIAVKKIITLGDPVGSYVSMAQRDDGLIIGRMRAPIGVIMMIYESRPNVTIDAFCLCFKSSNVSILRGGKEAKHTNAALGKCIEAALLENKLDKNMCAVIDNPDRELMNYLLKESGNIDMVIPRGGESLIKHVLEHSTIPVVCHDKGVCHLYIESDADRQTAIDIAVNAKAQRTSVCNATECILFHKDFKYIKDVCAALLEKDVEIRVCSNIYNMLEELSPHKKVLLAADSDYGHEFLAKKVAMKMVTSFDKAVAHINKFGSHHTDSIITNNFKLTERFKKEIDSAVVMINASTRLSDGGEFGLGAEIGISNQKLHSRGPMGLADLTSVKYVVVGQGHIRK